MISTLQYQNLWHDYDQHGTGRLKSDIKHWHPPLIIWNYTDSLTSNWHQP